jgi:hypothetical protein
MAFEYTVDGRYNEDCDIVTYGTFTNGASDAGGDVVTGLQNVRRFKCYHKGSSVVADNPTVYETFPLTSGTVTIATTAGADGYWYAVGN